jgi:predicted MFS family arabinose efflux permease
LPACSPIAVLSALALVGVLALFPTVANPPAIKLSTRLALLRKPTVFVTLLVTLAFFVGHFTVYTYLGLFLQQVTHLNSVGISSVFFLFGLLSLLGNVISGYGIDRWGAVWTAVPCLVVIVLSPEEPGVVLSLNRSALYLGSAGGLPWVVWCCISLH